MKWLVRLALVVVLAVAVYWLHPAVLRLVPAWLDISESPRPADYVLALPGDEQTRPFVAAALVNVGLAEKVVVLGTVLSPLAEDGIDQTTRETTLRVLEVRGVDPARIVSLEGESSTTFSDAAIFDEFLREQPDATVAVVTNAFHTRRARWIFRRVLGERSKQIYFVSAPMDRVDPDRWWTCEEGIRTYLTEYAKFGFYLVRYGDLRMWVFIVASALLVVGLFYWRRSRRDLSTEEA